MTMRIPMVVAGMLFLAGCGQDQGGADVPAAQEAGPALPSGEITELVAVDVTPGDGDVAEAGMTAVVHYTGWLYEPDADDRRGTQFDSSRERGRPFEFPLGAGRVIRGWDHGVAGMRVGGRRLLFIPPDLAYGSRGAGNVIPPDATLFFDVELLDLRRPE